MSFAAKVAVDRAFPVVGRQRVLSPSHAGSTPALDRSQHLPKLESRCYHPQRKVTRPHALLTDRSRLRRPAVRVRTLSGSQASPRRDRGQRLRRSSQMAKLVHQGGEGSRSKSEGSGLSW